jgi:hypothetical protein
MALRLRRSSFMDDYFEQMQSEASELDELLAEPGLNS